MASIVEACGAALTGAAVLAGAGIAVLRWAAKYVDRRMKTVMETVADWLDDIDEHLAEQDVRMSQADQRLDRVEDKLGVERRPLAATPRRRKRPRRVEVAERGFGGSTGR